MISQASHALAEVLAGSRVPDPAVAAAAAELCARESTCCSFFAFTLTIRDGVIVLGVETPPAHAGVLAAIADRAESLISLPASRPA